MCWVRQRAKPPVGLPRMLVKKGPEMMVKNVMPAIQEREGPGELLQQATGGRRRRRWHRRDGRSGPCPR